MTPPADAAGSKPMPVNVVGRARRAMAFSGKADGAGEMQQPVQSYSGTVVTSMAFSPETRVKRKGTPAASTPGGAPSSSKAKRRAPGDAPGIGSGKGSAQCSVGPSTNRSSGAVAGATASTTMRG